MKPIGPLMWEHRLIERMVSLMSTELQSFRKGNIDTVLIDSSIDFFRTYAEQLHFRKEEDFLFATLERKDISSELRKTMSELIEEHALLKQKVDIIIDILNKMDEAGTERRGDMIKPLAEMLELYPPHMEKEDKHFFYPCLEYLSQQEQDEMLERFQEFDAKLLHRKYQDIVAGMESTLPPA